MARGGILNYAAAQDVRVSQFRDALRQLGYAEGRNVAVTYLWADGAKPLGRTHHRSGAACAPMLAHVSSNRADSAFRASQVKAAVAVACAVTVASIASAAPTGW